MAGSFFGRLVQPLRRLFPPTATPIADPIASPIATPIASPLTNIDATDLAHPENAARIRDALRQSGLPVAQSLDKPLPDPLWISRWQNSTSPPDERPWVKGFRWWIAGVQYENWFSKEGYRIDFLWSDHAHAYWDIPFSVWNEFRTWTGSVGHWFHENILVANWKPGAGSRYPDREISRH